MLKTMKKHHSTPLVRLNQHLWIYRCMGRQPQVCRIFCWENQIFLGCLAADCINKMSLWRMPVMFRNHPTHRKTPTETWIMTTRRSLDIPTASWGLWMTFRQLVTQTMAFLRLGLMPRYQWTRKASSSKFVLTQNRLNKQSNLFFNCLYIKLGI